MRIAITGGTGFIGAHLAARLAAEGHEVIALSRGTRRPKKVTTPRIVLTDLSDPEVFRQAFAGCDAVAHCAGSNREIGAQTFQKVHVDGTGNVHARSS